MRIGTTPLLNAGVCAWLTPRVVNARHAALKRGSTNQRQWKFASTTGQLRTAQVRTHTELEQARNGFERQPAAVAEQARAAAARAEERLRAACEELDRMRRGSTLKRTPGSETTDGFAVTRPMREGFRGLRFSRRP